MHLLALSQRDTPGPIKGCIRVSLYFIVDQGIRLATVREVDCRTEHVDLQCRARESCNIAIWSEMELCIIPPTLSGVVAGRALASLISQMAGGGILCRLDSYGPERLIRVLSGCAGHLLHQGCCLLSHCPAVTGDSRLESASPVTLENLSALKTSLERWVNEEIIKGCHDVGVGVSTLARPPLRCGDTPDIDHR
jgi:hypothetical protein